MKSIGPDKKAEGTGLKEDNSAEKYVIIKNSCCYQCRNCGTAVIVTIICSPDDLAVSDSAEEFAVKKTYCPDCEKTLMVHSTIDKKGIK